AAGARVAAGVTGVARTGIRGVRAARVAGGGAAGVGRGLPLLGARENQLGFGVGEDLLVLLFLLHLFAGDGLDLGDDLHGAAVAFFLVPFITLLVSGSERTFSSFFSFFTSSPLMVLPL